MVSPRHAPRATGFEWLVRATRHAPRATGFILATLSLFFLLLTAPVFAAEGSGGEGKTVYIVNDYRYEPGDSKGDPDTGHALCATRCNSLSFDYVDYQRAGAWEITKISGNVEKTIPLDNPFMQGDCVCTVDEYIVKPNLRNRTK